MAIVPIWGERAGSEIRFGPPAFTSASSSGVTGLGDGISWRFIRRFTFDSNIVNCQRYYGEWNIHSALERIVGDDNEFIRFESLVYWDDLGQGANRKAWFGFFRQLNGNLPNGIAGCGWIADLEEGYLYTHVSDAPNGTLPINVRKNTRTAFRCRLGVDRQFLGVRINGQTRSVEFFVGGELVDWYTIPDGEALGPTGGLPRALFHAQVSNGASNGNLYYYHNGAGDAFVLTLGQFDVQASVVLPDPPVLTEVVTTSNATTTDSSEIAPDTLEHLATQWRITLDSDPSFNSPVQVTGWVCGSRLLRNTFSGLTPETTYLIQARHGSNNGISDWSDSLEITTDEVTDPGGEFEEPDPPGGVFSDCVGPEDAAWSGCS